MRKYSFWKPTPIPMPDATLVESRLLPFGPPEQVLDQILTIPHTSQLPAFPCSGRVSWGKDNVILYFEEDETMIAPGEVISMVAVVKVADAALFRLYVQIFERLEAVLLDEQKGIFLPPQAFKRRARQI